MILEGIQSQYQDLGQVITGTNMAAGATINSNWYDNVQWVRNAVLAAQSDQQYDIQAAIKDTSTILNSYTVLSNSTAITGAWKLINLIAAGSTPATAGLFGYSVRFTIKNSSAVSNTIANLRVQLMGV